jgi:hypothetical protein
MLTSSSIVALALLVSIAHSGLVKPKNDFCANTKCHENAECVNREFGAQCICNFGFYGNGVDRCFGIYLKNKTILIFLMNNLSLRMWTFISCAKCWSHRRRSKKIK